MTETEYAYGTASAGATGGSGDTANAYKCFDNDGETVWNPNALGLPAWIIQDYGSGVTHVINKYKITSRNNVNIFYPTAWTLYGSNNGSDWDSLDSRSGQTFTQAETKTYDGLANTTAYRYYKLNVTAALVSSQFVIAEIEYWNVTLPPISKINGVSWASISKVNGTTLSGVDKINGVSTS